MFLSKTEAVARWGMDVLQANDKGVTHYRIIVDHDGTWKPVYNWMLELKGYRRDDCERPKVHN